MTSSWRFARLKHPRPRGGGVVAVQGVNTDADERQPVVTADGRTMYALIVPPSPGEVGIATRTNSGFTSLSPATIINSAQIDIPGVVLPDNSALWFASNRNNNSMGQGQFDLFRAARSGNQFGGPELVEGTDINDPEFDDANPVVTPDELTLFFASRRSDDPNRTDTDIWMARRSSVADRFEKPTNLEKLNTENTDAPSWVSADGCVLYITSGPDRAYSIYVATRGM
jgi:WD40-like Beta Propeller Repeat